MRYNSVKHMKARPDGLSKKQAETLKFIAQFMVSHQYAPSFREIADHFGQQSKSPTQCTLLILREKGFISYEDGCPRTLKILNLPLDLSTVKPQRFTSNLGLLQEIQFAQSSQSIVSDDRSATLEVGSVIVEIQPFLALMEMEAEEFDHLVELTIATESLPFHFFEVETADGSYARGFDAALLARVIDAFAFENIDNAVTVRDIMLEKAVLQMLEVIA